MPALWGTGLRARNCPDGEGLAGGLGKGPRNPGQLSPPVSTLLSPTPHAHLQSHPAGRSQFPSSPSSPRLSRFKCFYTFPLLPSDCLDESFPSPCSSFLFPAFLLLFSCRFPLPSRRLVWVGFLCLLVPNVTSSPVPSSASVSVSILSSRFQRFRAGFQSPALPAPPGAALRSGAGAPGHPCPPAPASPPHLAGRPGTPGRRREPPGSPGAGRRGGKGHAGPVRAESPRRPARPRPPPAARLKSRARQECGRVINHAAGSPRSRPNHI